LTAAFYLAERRYTTQAYSHLRTVNDLLDKAELFFCQPQWAEVWGSGDRDKILKELKPSAVRKKLGRPGFDPIYGFFTELGTHGTFEALQQRVTQTGKNEDRTQVAMRIGGTPWESEVEMAIACSIFMVLSTLIMVGKVYETRLHIGELIAILRTGFKRGTGFLQEHFVNPRVHAGIDVSAVTESFKKLLLVLESVEAALKPSA
jgi:hypothetical protein